VTDVWCTVQIFMKVDTNCDGTVDWNEYITYMLLEEQQRQAMNFDAGRRCLPTELVRRVKPGRKSPGYDHSDDVVRIVFQPATHRDGNIFKVCCNDKTVRASATLEFVKYMEFLRTI